MTAVRPDLPLNPPPTAPATAQVKAAQAAFFRAALDRAQAPAATPPVTPGARPARPNLAASRGRARFWIFGSRSGRFQRPGLLRPPPTQVSAMTPSMRFGRRRRF
jgi:hypothetical protein